MASPSGSAVSRTDSPENSSQIKPPYDLSSISCSSQIPCAPVRCWNDSSAYVSCPFCNDIHRYCFFGYRQAIVRCTNPPNPPGLYRIQFPFNVRKRCAWYSFDRRDFLFMNGSFSRELILMSTLAAEVPRYYEQALVSGPRWSQAKDPGSFTSAIDYIEKGLVLDVAEFLKHSPETKLLLHGIDDCEGDTKGRTALHIAASKENSEIVALLLDASATVNAQDTTGRTPLMEAALWGRLENVRLLLRHGADRSLICSCGSCALKAVDFARDSTENDAERTRKSKSGEWHGSRTQNHVKMIPYLLDIYNVMLLTDAMMYPELTGGRRGPWPYKTTGAIARSYLPLVILTEDDHFIINGSEVTSASSIIGCPMVPEANGCHHAAQHLAMYFIHHHHYHFPEIITHLPERKRLQALGRIQPPIRVTDAIIVVYSRPCDGCRWFIKEAKRSAGLNLPVCSLPPL